MTFGLDRWRSPRATIANRYEHNDAGYALSGMRLASDIIRKLEYRPSQLRVMRALDFGCGTGRVSRPLSLFFAETVGYDPSPECIETARAETLACDLPPMASRLHFVSEIPGSLFDVVVCTCVLWHLPPEEQADAFRQICGCVKPGGCAVVQVHRTACSELIRSVWHCELPESGKKTLLLTWSRPCNR